MNIIEAWQSGMGQIGNFFGDFFGGLWDGGVSLLNGIFGGIGDLISGWLNSLGLNLSLPANIYQGLHEVSIGVGYIIPIRALLPIPMFMLSFYIAKLIFAVYQLVAGLIIRRVKLNL